MQQNYPYGMNPNRPGYPTRPEFSDHGPNPYVVNLAQATRLNRNFRTALWTGTDLQLVLMRLPVGGEIGLEIHPDVDQFFYFVEGIGTVKVGPLQDHLDFQRPVQRGYGLFIPAGSWHNIINTGSIALQLFTVYAPPQHPRGTIHRTKAESDAAENQER